MDFSKEQLQAIVEVAYQMGLKRRDWGGPVADAYAAEVVNRLFEPPMPRTNLWICRACADGDHQFCEGCDCARTKHTPAKPKVCEPCAKGDHHRCAGPCECYIAGQ